VSVPWNVQVLRLTLFSTAAIDGSGLWQTATGLVPEVDEHRPREAIRRQAGQISDDAFLELVITTTRLDWVLSSFPMTEFSYLGDVATALSVFDKMIVPWLETRPGITVQRIAFGLIAVSPTPDREASYALLQKLVPSVRYDPEHTREVAYQVNRPVVSPTIQGLELNRITKWSALRFLSGVLNMQSGAMSPDEPRFSARSECDHSTPAERVEIFTADEIIAIYSELRDLAVANLEGGEIP
jgi:hypothetical protein